MNFISFLCCLPLYSTRVTLCRLLQLFQPCYFDRLKLHAKSHHLFQQ
jgi:hypothetical protein